MGSGTTVTCDGTNCGLRCASTTTPNFCANVCVADSLTTCGPSCQTCTPPANGTAVCSVGVCDFTCQTGFHRCGMQCLADSSVDSCGLSCSACPAGPPNTVTSCARPTPTSQFACSFDCGPGTNRCPAGGTQCVPTDYTLACGPTCAVCSSTVSLERGVCGTNGICSTGCINSCNSMCVNAQTSATNCGTCNNACSGNDRCSQGECRSYCASGVGLASMLPSIPMVTSAFPFVVVDVDGDNRVDHVSVQSSTLYVRLGLSNAAMTGPSGTFSPTPTTYSLGIFPTQIVAGDITGDGRPEIILISTSSSVDVLRNGGTGLFTRYSITPSTAVAGSFAPSGVTIGEFTGAAPADVIFSFNTASGTQSAALFAGTGLAGSPISTGVSAALGIGTVSNVRAASITADANPDLVATAASNAIYIYPGTGNGTTPFSPAMAVLAQLPSGESFTTGVAGSSFMMDVGDVTADGIPDVVVPVVTGATNGVRVFPLTAVPAFGTSTFLTLPSAPRAIVIADVNGDSRRDVVVASTDVRVFLSQVGGTFSAAQVLGIAFNVTFFNALAVVDVTGDSRPEILAPAGLSVVTAVNNGTGGFAALQGFSVPTATRISAGDLNGDGFSDAVATGPLPLMVAGADARLVDAVSTINGTVRGRLEVQIGGVWGPVCAPISFPTSTTMAVACRSVGLGSWYNYFYAAPSALAPLMRSPSCSSSLLTSLLSCTYSTPDVSCTTANQLGIECTSTTPITPDSTSQVLYGSSTGTFTAGSLLTTRGESTVVGNLNGDTAQDLVVAALGAFDGGMGPVLEVRFGATNNTLSPPTTLAARATPTFLLIAEVSNDTAKDLIVGSASGVDVYRNLGFGTFAAPVTVTTTGVSSIAVADLNLDGRRDLVTASTAFTTVQPWLNVALPGSVGFLAGTSIFPSAANFNVLAGDVTYDGKPDLVFGRYMYSGNGAGGFVLQTSSLPTLPPRQVLADLDNDGALDLASAGAASSIVSVLPGLATSFSGFGPTPAGYSPGTFVEDVALARTNTDSARDLIVLQGSSGARSVVAAPGVCR